MMLVKIEWGTKNDGVFYMPTNVQQGVFDELGRENYFKKPPRNTNPRGVEYSKEAITHMINHDDTMKIKIDWIRNDGLKVDIYEKWEEYWKED